MSKKQKPREIALKRRERVKELYFVRNYTIAEVSKILNWNPRTIFRDIEAIREDFGKQIKIIDAKNILNRLTRIRSKIIQRLWKQYDNAETTYLKILALTKIDDIEQKNIKDLQELGFIPKPTEVIETRTISEEDKREFIKILQKNNELKEKFIKLKKKSEKI